jgi:hypothetical protein
MGVEDVNNLTLSCRTLLLGVNHRQLPVELYVSVPTVF